MERKLFYIIKGVVDVNMSVNWGSSAAMDVLVLKSPRYSPVE